MTGSRYSAGAGRQIEQTLETLGQNNSSAVILIYSALLKRSLLSVYQYRSIYYHYIFAFLWLRMVSKWNLSTARGQAVHNNLWKWTGGENKITLWFLPDGNTVIELSFCSCPTGTISVRVLSPSWCRYVWLPWKTENSCGFVSFQWFYTKLYSVVIILQVQLRRLTDCLKKQLQQTDLHWTQIFQQAYCMDT